MNIPIELHIKESGELQKAIANELEMASSDEVIDIETLLKDGTNISETTQG